MALFKKKPKLANIPVQTTTELWTKTFPQSGSFKGFRRIKLTTYGEDLVQDTLAYFAQSGYNFKGCTIYDKVHLRVEDGEVYLFVHII